MPKDYRSLLADLVKLDELVEEQKVLLDTSMACLAKLEGNGFDMQQARLQVQIFHGVQLELVEKRNALREEITRADRQDD